MDYTTLGRTGLRVSRACLGGGGSSRLGSRHGESEAHIIELIHGALDMGINFFDTAPAYGTEAVLGTALRGHRDQVVLSSKVRCVQPGLPLDALVYCSPADIDASVHESLRQLRTDHIDVVHLHGIRPPQYEHVMAVLLPRLMALRDAGKIGFIGLTEAFGSDDDHVVAQQAIRDGHFDVLMAGYSIINPSLARTVLPMAAASGIGLMCMCAVRGALASRSAISTLVAELVACGEIDEADVNADDPLGFLIDEGHAGTLAEAAYRFCRRTPGIDVVMTGTGSIAHLKDNVAAILGNALPSATLERLATAFAGVRSATGALHDRGREGMPQR